jgi:hypothetical protein
MALTSFKITKKIFETFYSPKVSKFDRMVGSINSSMGYGQTIELYVNTKVLNTYYHVWDNDRMSEVVMDATSGEINSVEQAGPMFWGVTSQQGISFLNGTISISGLRKLKYCNGCEDRNTIGIYPLKGKLLNVRGEQIKKIAAGQELMPFKYLDKGSMATIGRHKAIVEVKSLRMTGIPAWYAWLWLHLFYLLGGRNKIGTMADWTYNYLTFDRGNRHIMDSQ